MESSKPSKDYIKQCVSKGITHTSDGLLLDFIDRGNYQGVLLVITKAIEKRQQEIKFLKTLKVSLNQEIKSSKELKNEIHG